MELEDLEAKSRVAVDLFEKGAARVKITGTDIEVDWRKYVEATSGDKGAVFQAVRVNVSATALASASISEKIQEIAKGLEQSGVDPEKVPEAKAHLDTIEKELKKTRPRWNVTRKVLRWALDFSEEIFLRLGACPSNSFSQA